MADERARSARYRTHPLSIGRGSSEVVIDRIPYRVGSARWRGGPELVHVKAGRGIDDKPPHYQIALIEEG